MTTQVVLFALSMAIAQRQRQPPSFTTSIKACGSSSTGFAIGTAELIPSKYRARGSALAPKGASITVEHATPNVEAAPNRRAGVQDPLRSIIHDGNALQGERIRAESIAEDFPWRTRTLAMHHPHRARAPLQPYTPFEHLDVRVRSLPRDAQSDVISAFNALTSDAQ